MAGPGGWTAITTQQSGYRYRSEHAAGDGESAGGHGSPARPHLQPGLTRAAAIHRHHAPRLRHYLACRWRRDSHELARIAGTGTATERRRRGRRRRGLGGQRGHLASGPGPRKLDLLYPHDRRHQYAIKVRAVDDSGNLRIPRAAISIHGERHRGVHLHRLSHGLYAGLAG